MDRTFKEELKTLMRHSGGPCVSIYMPVYRAGREIEQNGIRLTNLLRESERQLGALGLRSPQVKELLSPAQKLLTERFFTGSQADGLAVFISETMFHYFPLPAVFEELAVVGDRFHLKPVLPLAGQDDRFYILAISRKSRRLFRCTRQEAEEVNLEGVPESMDEVVSIDATESRPLFRAVAQGASGRGGTTFHGHGGGIEEDKSGVRLYFIKVNEGVRKVLKEEQAPLVFAGVDFQMPIYREVNSHPVLLDEFIAGNPEGLSAEDLHKEALNIVDPYFRKARDDAVARYLQMAGTGMASDDLSIIVPASCAGRIEVLFVPKGLQQWGEFDPNTCEITLYDKAEPGSEDLLDFAAIQTILCGGTVYAMEPGKRLGNGLAAALFRY